MCVFVWPFLDMVGGHALTCSWGHYTRRSTFTPSFYYAYNTKVIFVHLGSPIT